MGFEVKFKLILVMYFTKINAFLSTIYYELMGSTYMCFFETSTSPISGNWIKISQSWSFEWLVGKVSADKLKSTFLLCSTTKEHNLQNM